MRGYDHFHAMVELSDGTKEEVEGGWTGYPKDFEAMDQEQRRGVLLGIAKSWSRDPEKVTALKSFHLAG